MVLQYIQRCSSVVYIFTKKPCLISKRDTIKQITDYLLHSLWKLYRSMAINMEYNWLFGKASIYIGGGGRGIQKGLRWTSQLFDDGDTGMGEDRVLGLQLCCCPFPGWDWGSPTWGRLRWLTLGRSGVNKTGALAGRGSLTYSHTWTSPWLTGYPASPWPPPWGLWSFVAQRAGQAWLLRFQVWREWAWRACMPYSKVPRDCL